jgi:hypothetical protein
MATTPTRVGGRPADDLAQHEEPRVNKSLVAAGAFLAVIVVIALLVFLRGGDKATSTPAPGPAPGPSAPNPVPADTAVPTSPPPARWDLYRTVALPYSESAGPAVVNGPVASGFAHTPTGALLATVHAGYRKSLALNSELPTVTTSMIQPGPGRDAYVQLRQQYPVTAPPAPGEATQLAGFRFVTYTLDTAVIQLVSRNVNGAFQMTTSTVAWDGSDWKLVLQANGADSPTAQRVPSLDGFVVWGGI